MARLTKLLVAPHVLALLAMIVAPGAGLAQGSIDPDAGTMQSSGSDSVQVEGLVGGASFFQQSQRLGSWPGLAEAGLRSRPKPTLSSLLHSKLPAESSRPAWFYPAVGAGIGGLVGGAVMGYVILTGGENFAPYHTLAFGVALGAAPGAVVGWLLTPTGGVGR